MSNDLTPEEYEILYGTPPPLSPILPPSQPALADRLLDEDTDNQGSTNKQPPPDSPLLGCLMLFVAAAFLIGGCSALFGGDEEPLTAEQIRVEIDALEEAIDGDSDEVRTIELREGHLFINIVLGRPILDDPLNSFSGDVVDIAWDVVKSDLPYETLQIAVDSPQHRAEFVRVLDMTFDRAALDSVDDWPSLNEVRFTERESVRYERNDLYFGENEAPSPGQDTKPESSPTTVDSTICSVQGSAIPIDRSCFVYWPLTIESGELWCVDFNVFFVDEFGTEYGVNGNASGQEDRFADIELLLTDNPTERSALDDFIAFATEIPGCAINGVPGHILPSAQQTTTLPQQPTGAILGAVQGTAVCLDALGDLETGQPGPGSGIPIPNFIDLQRVELTVTESELLVRWETAGEIPTNIAQRAESGIEAGSFVVNMWTEDIGFLPEGQSFRSVLLVIDFGEEGVFAGHESSGDGAFGSVFEAEGEFVFEGNIATAVFAIANLAAMPAEFNWTSSIEATVFGDQTDPSSFAVASDSACPSIADQGQPFPSE